MHAQVDKISSLIPQRLSECAEKAGGKRALAQLTHISEAQLFRYINGVTDIPAQRLIAIALAADVSPAWLLTGDAPALTSADAQPSFREALLSNIVQILGELLLEYEKNFTPSQRAKAISFIYKALRHEEHLRGEDIVVTKPVMLGFVNFLVDVRHEDTLSALSHAVDFFEYSPQAHIVDYAAHAGEFSAFVNFIIRAYEHYYNSATGRAYFDRLGTQILPHTAKQLDEVVAYVQETHAHPNLRILDVGCGSGRDISYLHRHYSNLEVHGIDQADSALAICEELVKRNYLAANSVQKSDARTIPFPPETFNLITSRQTLYCLPCLQGSGLGVETLLQEIHRALKSDGFFYVVSRFGKGTEYLPFCQYYNRASFTTLAESQRFRVIWFKEDDAKQAFNTTCSHLSASPSPKYNRIFRALIQKI